MFVCAYFNTKDVCACECLWVFVSMRTLIPMVFEFVSVCVRNISLYICVCEVKY